MTHISATFLSYAGLMGKVYFPRLCAPIATVISRQFQFLVQFSLFFLISLYYSISGFRLAWEVQMLLIPLLIAELLLLSLGCGILLTSLTVRYRDLTVLVSFGLQIWMYVTPVVYSASQVPQKWRFFYLMNPVAPVMEAFRSIWFGNKALPVMPLFISVGITILIFIAGTIIFQRVQRNFIDTI